MLGIDEKDLFDYVIANIRPNLRAMFGDTLPGVIQEFMTYDAHYIYKYCPKGEKKTHGLQGYDEDDAMEYILDAYMEANPADDETELRIASLLDQYLQLTAECVDAKGLFSEE